MEGLGKWVERSLTNGDWKTVEEQCEEWCGGPSSRYNCQVVVFWYLRSVKGSGGKGGRQAFTLKCEEVWMPYEDATSQDRLLQCAYDNSLG